MNVLPGVNHLDSEDIDALASEYHTKAGRRANGVRDKVRGACADKQARHASRAFRLCEGRYDWLSLVQLVHWSWLVQLIHWSLLVQLVIGYLLTRVQGPDCRPMLTHAC